MLACLRVQISHWKQWNRAIFPWLLIEALVTPLLFDGVSVTGCETLRRLLIEEAHLVCNEATRSEQMQAGKKRLVKSQSP